MGLKWGEKLPAQRPHTAHRCIRLAYTVGADVLALSPLGRRQMHSTPLVINTCRAQHSEMPSYTQNYHQLGADDGSFLGTILGKDS